MVQTDPSLKKIDLMATASGRARKEDDTVVNYADMIEAIYKALVVDKNAGVDLGNAVLPVLAELVSGTVVGLINGTEVVLANGTTVQIAGNTLAEQKTQVDAVANVLTFSQNIGVIEIYHKEATFQTFIVNGLSIVIPAGGYRTPIAGVASPNVTIPAGINCIVGRLI